MSSVESNYRLNLQAAAERTYLNSGCHVRLFTALAGGVPPTPANVLADFTEASFTGYAGIALTSAFGAQAKVIDGQYGTSTGQFTWTCTGGSPQTILGYYVEDGTGLLFSESFPAGIVMSNGGPSFILSLTYYQYARSIL